MACAEPAYRPRDAEHSVLHQVVSEHLEAFLRAVAEAGDGVSRTTIGKLRRDGQLQARICDDHGEWLYWLPEPIPSMANPSSPTPADPIVTSTVGGAV